MATKAELERELADLKAQTTAAAARIARWLPAWAFWTIVGVVAVVLAFGLWFMWGVVFGSGVEAAKEAEKLHKALMALAVASVVSVGATTVQMLALTFLLDRFTVRREFLKEVSEGNASPMDMAIFACSTALFAGLVFLGTITAMST